MSQSVVFELIVPCFNEAASLPILIRSSQKAATDAGLNSEQFQLVLVDNGSSDNTPHVLEEEKRGVFSSWFRIVSLKTNQGYGGGIYAGLKSSLAPWVGFIHADLQCHPEEAFKAFQDCQKSSRPILVRGVRRNRKFTDWLVSRLYEFALGGIWGLWKFDVNAQPKVFSRNLIGDEDSFPRGIAFDAWIIKKACTSKFLEKRFPVMANPRLHGISHWARNPMKRIQTYFAVLTELCENR